MSARAKEFKPFSSVELEEIIESIKNVAPEDCSIDFEKLKALIGEVGHVSHKDWDRTGSSAAAFRPLFLGNEKGLSGEFKKIFDRVIKEGNWDNAMKHGESQNDKPWVVLVTGVNGIRKTTSVYQSWFPALLAESIIVPDGAKLNEGVALPCGENSFFRQLDHMIATLINYNFQTMYDLTSKSFDFENSPNDPPPSVIQNYSDYKAAIFSRYRTLSEILGVLLVREAQESNLNVMIETSGRDIAMFHYVDSFFPASKYNKLALHFTINDLTCAESSVDSRMIKEMRDGIKSMELSNIKEIIKANAGGPYGSEVLKGIQSDSDSVWKKIMQGEESVGGDWFKANMRIIADKDNDWTAQAVLPDGSDGKIYKFEAPRKV